MKKIFLSLIILSLFGTIYGQKNIGDFKTINVREKIHNGNYQLIGQGDSAGQFYYRNMQNPERPLDGVNLRTLRSYYNTFFDTIVVFAGDTVIIPAPDTFRIVTIDTNYWLHSGETLTIPAYADTIYNSYTGFWIGNNEAIYFPPADTTYSMFDKKWKGLNDTIKADSVIYIRPRPGCTGCWDYHTVGSNTWHQWFCTENDKPNLLSTPNTDSLLLIDWFTEFPDQGIVTSGYYLGFVIDPANYGKVFYMSPDSAVKWIDPNLIINDTLLFSEYENKYKLRGDTLKTQIDSIRVDTIYSQITRTDTIFSQISRVDSVYSIINRTQYVFNQVTNTDTVFSQVSRIDTVYSQILRVDSIYLLGQRLKDEKVIIRDRLNLYGSNPGYLDTHYFGLYNTGLGYNTIVPKDTLWSRDEDGIHSNLNHVGIGSDSWGNTLLRVADTTSNDMSFMSMAKSNHSGFFVSYPEGNHLTHSAVEIYVDNSYNGDMHGLFVTNSTDGYSGQFSGGIGFKADSITATTGINTTILKVGTGATISRTGTMASYDKWTGTQAEWTANTPKDGIYPQASTTFWTIKD